MGDARSRHPDVEHREAEGSHSCSGDPSPSHREVSGQVPAGKQGISTLLKRVLKYLSQFIENHPLWGNNKNEYLSILSGGKRPVDR